MVGLRVIFVVGLLLCCLARSVDAFHSTCILLPQASSHVKPHKTRTCQTTPTRPQRGNRRVSAPLLQRLLRSWHVQSATTSFHMSTANGSEITPSSSKTRATTVYALILCNLGVFLIDKVFWKPFVSRNLYLFHRRWKWWQLLTSCFCHADRFHLSNNLFLLLLFGRSVEDDLGGGGLLFSYAFCGILASLVSLFLLPSSTVSIGASGAVFGLFAVSTVAKFSWKELLDWRKLVEVSVLGEFVVRQLASEVSTVANGGTAGINHVAHLSGAAAGAFLVFGMRAVVANAERAKKEKKLATKNKKKKDKK